MAAAAEFGPFCDRLGATSALASVWWSRLAALYPGPDRHYHTITHMNSLTDLWREYFSHFRRPDAVLAAVYFHDAVYDPKAPDNEEKSAELYRSFLADVGGDLSIKDVYEWIMATKDHRRATVTDPDLAFFLDMDLTILGSSREVYAEYAKNIRREYIHVPEPVYRTKRAEILRNFLAAEDLFRTPLLRARFAASTRDNLQWEIALLGSTQPLL